VENTCIITGASRGIGRAISVKISQTDYFKNIILLARSSERLKKTKELMNKNINVKHYSIDLMNYEVIEMTIAKIADEFGKINALINVAGFVDPKSLLETSVENWEKTFKINVGSVFVITREVVKHMKSTGGKIVNFASTAGMTPRPGWVAYAASKAAVISMSQTLSDELKEYGIKVYCVSPGRCATDLRKILAPEEDPTTIMQPEDVADFIVTLLSPHGDILDGQNIVLRKQIII
jgi:3-oxoacyl-[acyl-carrier protein] reductase